MKRGDSPENIELQSYCVNSTNDSDIEEYHEINVHSNQETALSSLYSTKTLKEYDFFTQNDVQIGDKSNGKQKKSKKKAKSENLMDIISSELASAAIPIKENVLTIESHVKEQQASCLAKVPIYQNLLGNRRRPFRTDFEYRSRNGFRPVDLSPIFPKVLENAASEDTDIPVQYVEPTMFKEFIASSVNIDQAAPKFLDIEIKNLYFKRHHTFSLEKLLCVKLVEYYNEYNIMQKLIKDLYRETKVNRETRDNLKQELVKVSPHKKDDIRFDPTVRKYSEKLIQSKGKYFETLKKKKELTHKIFSIWSDIEVIRDKSRCVTTSYILDVATKTLDGQDYEKEWNELFNTEFTDLLSKMEYDHISKYIEYKEMKNDQTIEYSRRKKMSKPKLEIHEDELKQEVEQIVNDIITKDSVDITLKTDESIITNRTSEKNNFHFNYHFEIFVDGMFVCESENYVNEMNNSLDLQVTELFSVQILPNNTSLTIVLSENNDHVSRVQKNLKDIKKSYANSEFSIENFVYNKTLEPTDKHVGSGHSIREIAKENKLRLKCCNYFKGNLYTTWESNIKIGWNEKLNHNQGENIKSSMEIGRKLKRLLHGIDKPNIDVLANVIAKIYSKDVENDDKIITTLRNVCKTVIKTDDTFPVPDEKSPEFVRLKLLHLRNKGGFTNVENKLVPLHGSQISTDQLKCLQKSDEKEFDIEYIHNKHVDADPIELQRFVGAKYVQKLNINMLKNLNDHLLKKTHKDVVRDFKDLSLRSFFSKNINLSALAAISGNTKQILLHDSLNKEQEVQITVLRAFNLLDRQEAIISEEIEDNDRIAGFKVRPLRPFVRVSYRGATVQTTTAIGCHPTWNQTVKIKAKPHPLSSIYINIYDEYKANIHEGYSGDQGRTVHYRYYHKWLGTLQIPLYTVLTLGMLHGTFKISTPPLIFGYETTSQKKGNSTQSLIPEVTQLMKKDMSFISLNLTTNLSHLGGLQAYNQPIPSGSDDDYLIKHLNNFVTEYINDFPSRNISLTFIDSSGKNKCVTHFLQPVPLPDSDWLPKNQKNAGSAMSKSSGISKSSSSKSSGGKRLEIDIEKGSVNEERESIYSAREGSWRSGENQIMKMMNVCLRYVALIPTYEVSESHVVTLSALELLKVLHGSPLDHTILLASYFLYLGIKCWVAIGLGFPRGSGSFVLTKYDLTTNRVVLTNDQLFKRGLFSRNDGYLWNVHESTTGERFELRDVSCPLKTVDYVFDNENIWVNVQSSQDCENLSFDFEKSSNWQPVFDKTIFVMKQPIVTDSSLYSAPGDVAKLRQSIEAKIRAKVHKWRPQMKTIWNRFVRPVFLKVAGDGLLWALKDFMKYCSGLLRELLPSWEYWSFNPSEPKPVLSQRLKQLLVTYKMFGFPLNMSYVNTKTVVASVKSTGVYVNEDPNAEFALAVELYAYPNNAISVWVFLACITRI